MSRHGFTIVELIITITIMGILMTLAVVSVNATQVRARDDERKADVEAIKIALDTYFNVGSDTDSTRGRYPTTNLTSSEAIIRSTLRDVNMQSFMAPNQTDVTESFIRATNSTQTTTDVMPQPTVGQYVYQPINNSSTLCTSGDCRKFNLYYRLESDNTVYKLMSKSQ